MYKYVCVGVCGWGVIDKLHRKRDHLQLTPWGYFLNNQTSKRSSLSQIPPIRVLKSKPWLRFSTKNIFFVSNDST
jgi:hypothetical protein